MQHRAYSISSSPQAHPGEVHLTVAAVRWENNGRPHRGVCSTYMADLAPVGSEVGVFAMPNKNFRVPQDDTVPMIMVGPGTGIAPFRRVLRRTPSPRLDRQQLAVPSATRPARMTSIYEDEIALMSSSGVLTRLDLAFSRDQEEKIYVQHRMKENGKDLFAQLEEGGYFFVCGDATRMAKDVDAALHKIIETHGGMSQEAAVEYVNAMKKDKRYVRDVY